MTRLRQIMLEELQRRNYAQTAIDCYIHTVEHFSRYFHRSPEQLGPQHIREYQAALFKKWKLAPNTVNQRLAALRFFYIQTLKRAWSVAETPYPKKVLKLPIILSQEEVARLINSALTPFHRMHWARPSCSAIGTTSGLGFIVHPCVSDQALSEAYDTEA